VRRHHITPHFISAGKRVAVGRIPKREAGKIIMSRLRCKSWQCDYCASKNRELWRSHLKKRIGRLGGEWWFVTVTAAEWNQTASKSLASLRHGLDLLFKRIRRIWGKIEYVRVYELHKTGAYHAHIIVCGLSSRVAYRKARSGRKSYIPVAVRGEQTWSLKTWFKKSARSLKMGYMVDVQAVNGIQKVVNYVCKYITKGGQDFDEPFLRRIQTSSGIGAANRREVGRGWTVGRHVWASDARNMPLYDANLKQTINPSYWQNNVVYPPQ